MSQPKNVAIAQSGGPTHVINSSLRGILDACREYPNHFENVYAGFHGVEGILKEELINLSDQPQEELALLQVTPAAGVIGTCRYKLKEQQKEDFTRIVEVFKAHDVGFFFYIGGNDSMDTAQKIAELAHKRGVDLVATGVPKTIDNDLGDMAFEIIDHTPGYGSVARYWALTIQGANQENAGCYPFDPVLILQAMGRRVGFIPAAARLADPDREMPLLIILPESGLSLENLADCVNEMVKERGRAMVVISEGFEVGEIGEQKDLFGHVMYSSSKLTVEQFVVNYLNTVGLPTHGVARGNIPGTDQRHSMIYASTVDLDEAYQLGKKAVQIAVEFGSGYMATILREPGLIYQVYYDKVPLEAVANSERTFPEDWINPSGTDVTDDYVRYAKPLIGNNWPNVPLINGIQRFARLEPLFVEKRLKDYIPQSYRVE
ncbi:MAG: diphosphate--fructose-6-phosphate 1-phosphotransferase [Anaerolineales bacterium]|nr:MAG: diphosphate--fructose-6-phosphate 1-phosphotransferase [Anaerolineales bacterium]